MARKTLPTNTDADRAAINRALRKLAKGITGGPGVVVTNTPVGLTIGLARPSGAAGAGRVSGFWAKITGSAEMGANRYKYAWTQQQETATGWDDDDDGETGTTSERFALNSCEANNSTVGVMGNSIDHDHAEYPSTNWLQPVRGSTVVWMRLGLDDNGDVTYRFTYPNAEQGPCA